MSPREVQALQAAATAQRTEKGAVEREGNLQSWGSIQGQGKNHMRD